MSVKIIFHQIEIGFWDVFIPLMYKSNLLRYFAPRVYRCFHSKEILQTVRITLVLMVLGLATGFFLGVMSQT